MALGLFALFDAATAAPAPTDGVPQDIAAWEALWTAVLARYVDDAGRVDFAALSTDPGDLERVVAFVGAVDPASRPELFPGRDDKLAYYINAYNALAMYGILRKNRPKSLAGFRKFTFFFWQTFTVGGGSISLYRLENDVIRPLGEERVHFALNCMVRGCPRLPRAAFIGERLDAQLDQVTRWFIGERRNVAIDTERRQVRLSAIFDFYTEDFTAQAPTLVDYVNRYRADPIPADFKVRFIDYDWTVNAQPVGAR